MEDVVVDLQTMLTEQSTIITMEHVLVKIIVNVRTSLTQMNQAMLAALVSKSSVIHSAEVEYVWSKYDTSTLQIKRDSLIRFFSTFSSLVALRVCIITVMWHSNL